MEETRCGQPETKSAASRRVIVQRPNAGTEAEIGAASSSTAYRIYRGGRDLLCAEQRKNSEGAVAEGRERLKRHREEVAGKVAVPEDWGQEKLLKEWMDYAPFDKLLAPAGLASARAALAAEGRRAAGGGGQRMRIESRCY
ncbi:unnamed protein product [Linum tenue]|uniref:Uncharacterized protein n=1 Tax=Linum tenue TaxID=586396 RepID=A0AAV0QGL3_9ROSI|nr:unnamed protein product [Linum tenue]